MSKQKPLRWGLICWLTYCTAYLCRVNFSASLTSLSAALSVDYSVLGAAGAAFFAVYAVGQLLNGFIGDHMHPVRFILTALVGTTVCNIGVAFAGRMELIFLLWAANGYFQSIFWSTIIRLLAVVTDKEHRGAASAGISSASSFGYLISWCILTPCFANQSVRLFFLTPAIAAVFMMAAWAMRMKVMQSVSVEPLSAQSLRTGVSRAMAVVLRERLPIVLVACVFHGLIKEGIGFWIPTIIRGMVSHPLYLAAALSLLPAANFAGTLLAKRLLKRWNDAPYRVVIIGYVFMLPCCAVTLALRGGWVLLPLSVITCLSASSNTVLLSFIPMRYQAEGVVASLVGMLDFCSYMGAAISTYVLGSMIGGSGVRGISVIWAFAALVCIALLLLKRRRDGWA